MSQTVTMTRTAPPQNKTVVMHAGVETATVDFTSPLGATCTVKLYRGIPPRELSDVLLAAFPSELRQATIVTFLQEHGDELVPLRAACKNPFLLGASVAVITDDALADGLQDIADEQEQQQEGAEEQYDHGTAAVAAGARGVVETAIKFRGEERRVGLSAGLSVSELTRLLWAVFPKARGQVITGFRQSSDRAPFLYAEEVCEAPTAITAPPLTLFVSPQRNREEAIQHHDDDDEGEEEEGQDDDVDYPEDESLDESLFPRISDEEARAIREIINKRDPRVRKAFEAFPDLQLLVNAFMRLARFSVAWSDQAERRRQARGEPALGQDAEDEYEERGEAAAVTGMTLEGIAKELNLDIDDPQSNARTIVDLRDEGLLEEDAAVILLLMLVQEHPLVFGAQVAYDVTGDKEDLVDSLKRIAAKVKRGLLVRQQQQGEPPQQEEEEDDDDDDDDGDDDDNVYKPFMTRLQELHERGLVSTSEVNAVEALLLADDDELIIQCFLDHDPTRSPPEHLVKSLLAVLRQRADELLAEHEDEDGGASSDSQPPPVGDSSDEDAQEKAVESSKKRRRDDSDDDDEEEDDDDDEDDDAWKERLGLDADVLVELLNQLSKDNNMRASEMTDFLRLLREGNDLVLGAYDAYVADKDVDEFTDTLQRILHHHETMTNADRKDKEKARQRDDDDEDEDEEEDEDEHDVSPLPVAAAAGANASGDDDTSEELQCISVLHSNKLLTDEQAELLWELILDHDPTIMAAFDAFAHTARWETLRDSLDEILERAEFFKKNRHLFDQLLADLVQEQRISLKVAELLQVAWENQQELVQAVFESEDRTDSEALKEDLQVLGEHLAEQQAMASGAGSPDFDDDDSASD